MRIAIIGAGFSGLCLAIQLQRAGFHSYTALTACRGLHACCEERQTSKAEAAGWAARRYPEWRDVIETAVSFRAGRRSAPGLSEAERVRSVAFLRFAVRETGIE